MTVKIKSNVREVIVQNEMNLPIALRFMLQDVKRVSEPKTPKDTGDLRANTLIEVMGRRATITWNQVYAVYQEGKKYGHYTTAGTGPHFAENAVADVMENAEQHLRRAGVIR